MLLSFFSRPTIKQLLNHEFFEDPGFALELCNRDAVLEQREHMVTFRLRFTDPKKQGDKIKVLRKPQPFFVVPCLVFGRAELRGKEKLRKNIMLDVP